MSEPSADDDWPGQAYNVGHRDQLLALGLIASGFNGLESAMLNKFTWYLNISIEISTKIFQSMSADKQIAVLYMLIERCTYPDEVKDREVHFLKGFNVCAENRNILMHSTVQLIDDDNIIFRKRNKKAPHNSNFYLPRTDTLRRVAGEIRTFQEYGHLISLHILKHYSLVSNFKIVSRLLLKGPCALPDKPPLPRTLSPQEGSTLRVDLTPPTPSPE